MTTMACRHLVLFFTRRMTLGTWDRLGMLDRETALYRRLRRRGVRVSLVTYGTSDESRYAARLEGIDICCNRRRLPRRVYERLIPWLHGRVLRSATVIKTNQTDGSQIALRAARFWAKPLIARGGYVWSEFEARRRGAESRAARRALGIEDRVFGAAERIVLPTPEMASRIARRYPSRADRLRVVPNYVDTDQFRPIDDASSSTDLIYVGRLDTQKNVAALLEAIRPLQVRLTIVGGGQQVEAWKRRYGDLAGRVVWKGNIPHHELRHLLPSAKVMVLPSLYEGSPKVLLEAMACGLAVVAARTPGTRQVITHGDTGVLCGTPPDSLRNAILKLLGDAALRHRLGRHARRVAESRYGLDRVLECEWELLREVASGCPPWHAVRNAVPRSRPDRKFTVFYN